MRALTCISAAAALSAAVALPANAHRMWMLPSTFTLSGEDQWVTVDAAISNDLFFPNHFPYQLSDITIIAPDGSTSAVEGGWQGKHKSTFELPLEQEGTYKITGGGGVAMAFWREDGEPRRARGSLDSLREQGVLDREDVNLRYFVQRVETFVTLGAPSEEALTPTGEGLELQPVTHPNDVYAGEDVSFRMVANGAPAANLEVTLIAGQYRYRDVVGEITATTDDDGAFTVSLPEPGAYWMNAELDETTVTVDGEELPAMLTYVGVIEALPL